MDVAFPYALKCPSLDNIVIDEIEPRFLRRLGIQRVKSFHIALLLGFHFVITIPFRQMFMGIFLCKFFSGK
jgi:hypothetical protein